MLSTAPSFRTNSALPPGIVRTSRLFEPRIVARCPTVRGLAGSAISTMAISGGSSALPIFSGVVNHIVADDVEVLDLRQLAQGRAQRPDHRPRNVFDRRIDPGVALFGNIERLVVGRYGSRNRQHADAEDSARNTSRHA